MMLINDMEKIIQNYKTKIIGSTRDDNNNREHTGGS